MRKNMLRASSSDVVGEVDTFTDNNGGSGDASVVVSGTESGDAVIITVSAIGTDGTFSITGVPSPTLRSDQVHTSGDNELYVYSAVAGGSETSVATSGTSATGAVYISVSVFRGYSWYTFGGEVEGAGVNPVPGGVAPSASTDIALAIMANETSALSTKPAGYSELGVGASGTLHFWTTFMEGGLSTPVHNAGTFAITPADNWLTATLSLSKD